MPITLLKICIGRVEKGPRPRTQKCGHICGDFTFLVRLRFFVGLWNVLPTCFNVKRKAVKVDHRCVVCGVEEDSNVHLFKDCNFTKAICWGRGLGWGANKFNESSFVDLFMSACEVLERHSLQSFVVLTWFIWSYRNDILWNQVKKDPGWLLIKLQIV